MQPLCEAAYSCLQLPMLVFGAVALWSRSFMTLNDNEETICQPSSRACGGVSLQVQSVAFPELAGLCCVRSPGPMGSSVS